MSTVNLISSVIDVGTIVDNLIYVDSAPVRLMQSQTAKLQNKVSAFQSLNTKLSSLLEKVNAMLFGSKTPPLQSPYTYADRLTNSIFASFKVTSSDDTAVSATASGAASCGSYSIRVSNLAQAKSVASSNFADSTSTQTGTGTITITTGSNEPVNITIDSSNATLSGVASAINAANAGVTASVINDGSSTPYRLLITADETGTANSFTVTDNLSGGQALNLTEQQPAADAQFSVNGISITKSSNTITDAINGVILTLKAETAGTVTLTLNRDIDAIVTSLQEMISAYNDVSAFINSQFTYNSTTKQAGLLSGDSTLRNIQTNLQSQFIQSIENRFTSYEVPSQIGLNFSRDGSLTLDEAKFRSALASNFTGVAALLLGDGTPSGGVTASDRRVTYGGKTDATQSGTYAIEVTSLAEQASVVGTQVVTNLSEDETLTITSGSASAIAVLLQNDSLATVLSKINSALTAQGMAVTASDDGTGKIQITTNSYGSDQSLTVVSDKPASSGSTGFGTSPVADTGADIEGSIGGNNAVGSGLTLTGASGQPEEGLTVNISQTVVGSYGPVTVASATKGVEGVSILVNLRSMLKGITDPLTGPIYYATDSLNQGIQNLNDRISAYQDLLEVRREMYTAQFQKADEALRLLTVTQSSLTSQINLLTRK